jgi:hypothetical protein
MSNSQQIAQTILNQLGGKVFTIMTGSKNFAALESGLSMRLAKNQSKAQYLSIKLNSLDLYDVQFIKVSKNFDRTTIAEFHGLYAEDLQKTFTEVTGMYTRL